jgi:hypothetical protein
MPVKRRDSKTLEISPLDRLSQFFHTFSLSCVNFKGPARVPEKILYLPACRQAGR